MNIDKTLHDNHHDIYLRAMSINREDAEDHIARCQAMLDSDTAEPSFPWGNLEEEMVGGALGHLEQIVLADWFEDYSAAEMQTMCRLLARCPDGMFAKIKVLDGLELSVSDVIREYNKMYPEANICLEDPDLG